MLKKFVTIIEAGTLIASIAFVGLLFVRDDDDQDVAVADDNCAAILAGQPEAPSSAKTDDEAQSDDASGSDDESDSDSKPGSKSNKSNPDNPAKSTTTTTAKGKGKATTTTVKGKGTTTTTTEKVDEPAVTPEQQQLIDDCRAKQANGGGDEAAESDGGGGAVDGKALYTASCASCHGSTGGGGIGPALSGGKVTKKYKDPAASLEIIAEGDGGMPGFADDLSPEELAAVNDYTRSL